MHVFVFLNWVVNSWAPLTSQVAAIGRLDFGWGWGWGGGDVIKPVLISGRGRGVLKEEDLGQTTCKNC